MSEKGFSTETSGVSFAESKSFTASARVTEFSSPAQSPERDCAVFA
jgi:hypothetical protein